MYSLGDVYVKKNNTLLTLQEWALGTYFLNCQVIIMHSLFQNHGTVSPCEALSFQLLKVNQKMDL